MLERLKSELLLSQEENALLKSSKRQLRLKAFVSLARKIELSWPELEFRFAALKELKSLCRLYLKEDPQELLRYFFERLSERMSLDDFLAAFYPLEIVVAKELRDDDFFSKRLEPQLFDKSFKKRKTYPLSFILHNLRSAFNVGSIFRTAECFGIEAVYLTGFTPSPLNPKLRKTALGAEKEVFWQDENDLKTLVLRLKEEKKTIYALETSLLAKSSFDFKLAKSACFLLGHERLGLDGEALSLADQIIKIPMQGLKSSLNVGVAAACVSHEFLRQRL